MPITVYMIENSVNDKKYVGQTCQNLIRRFRIHCSSTSCRALNSAINKYGQL